MPALNLKLCVVPSLAEHPLPAMLAAGLCVTINSDDPAHFGGYGGATSKPSCRAASVGRGRTYALLRNSLQASFVEPEQRRCGWRRWMRALLPP